MNTVLPGQDRISGAPAELLRERLFELAGLDRRAESRRDPWWFEIPEQREELLAEIATIELRLRSLPREVV